MKVLILGGFLGSGKTTLLMQMAHHLVDQDEEAGSSHVVILENEVGEDGVDDKLLRGSGLEVENLFDGCACCTLSGELVVQVHEIETRYNPSWLIIETTGLAYPGLIQDNLWEGIHVEARICTVVDAARWNRLRHPMETLFLGQIERADTVLLNKVDLISEEQAAKIAEEIAEMNAQAVIYRTSATEKIPIDIWEAVLGGEENG